jgi:hypothetical protein
VDLETDLLARGNVNYRSQLLKNAIEATKIVEHKGFEKLDTKTNKILSIQMVEICPRQIVKGN